MNTNDTQQEHIYNERIQENFPLFDKIKKEDDPIYNARVDFNTVKFLTKHANWNWDEEENKDKAYGVILQKCDKTKKAGQELESEVKERLKEYVDDVAGVSIYGNHASITLGDDKKEFKISEFLNSDFCEKNEISGFSTLHSDGKSGMHGFVAEEGGKKIRHYVVTDGSYEMTLNWYVNGEKCTIKVNIDKEGVKLIEGNGVTEDQLKANKDVKIGGLFLHEIEFGKKGKAQESEVQHNTSSFETTIRRDVKRDVNVQAAHMNREVGSQTPPLPPLRTSSLKKDVFDEQGGLNHQDDGQKMEFNKYIQGNTLDLHKLDSINIPELLEFLKKEQNITNINLGWNSIDDEDAEKLLRQRGLVIMENCHEDDEDEIKLSRRDVVVGDQTNHNNSQVNPGQSKKSLKDQKANSDFPTSDPSDSSIFTKSVSQDNKQEDERYDNPTFATFGHAVPGSQKPDRSEQTPNGQQKGAISDPSDSSTFTKSVSQDNRQKDERYDNPTFGHAVPGSQKPDRSEQTPNGQQKDVTSDPSDSSTFTKSVSQDNRQEDERYDNPTFGHAVPGSRKPDRSEQTPNNQQQPETQQQEGNSKGDLLQDIRNFKKNNLRHTDVDDRGSSITGSRKNNPSPLETLKDRIPYSPSPDIHNSDNQSASGAEWKESEQSFSVPKPNSKSDSGSSSQIHAQPQVDPEQPKRSLENIEQSDQTPPENLLKEIRDRSQQDNRGLRQVDPTDKLSQDKEDGLQKDNLADVKTVEGPTVNVSASTPNSISDSGYISPTSSDSKPRTDLKQVGRKLEEHINLTLFEELKNTLGQENLGLKPADQSQISEETKKRLREDGLLKDSSTDVKTNDSGYSSPTHANHEQSQVNSEQLKKSLENIEPKEIGDTSELKEALDKGLREPAQQATKENIPKDSFSENVLEKIGEGKQYDPIRKWLEKTVAERENADTSPTVDKNSELYKLLEKNKIQLEVGVIEEERKDTLTEHTDGYDRNRIALANRNKRPLDWAKQVAESQQEKDTKKGISI